MHAMHWCIDGTVLLTGEVKPYIPVIENTGGAWMAAAPSSPQKGDEHERSAFLQQLAQISPDRIGTRPYVEPQAERHRYRALGYSAYRSRSARTVIC